MLTGEFYLQGVPEMASGFRINPDSTFDFFFIYGAVDRFGRGVWALSGDEILLDSPPKGVPDFMLQTAKIVDHGRIVIQVTDPNTAILRYVLCRLETTDGETLQGESDANGRIVFEPKKPVRNIALLHELWPNEPCVTEAADPANNYFEFTISPSIIQIVFTDVVLRHDGNNLRGGHPLMKGDDFLYRRAAEA